MRGADLGGKIGTSIKCECNENDKGRHEDRRIVRAIRSGFFGQSKWRRPILEYDRASDSGLGAADCLEEIPQPGAGRSRSEGKPGLDHGHLRHHDRVQRLGIRPLRLHYSNVH